MDIKSYKQNKSRGASVQQVIDSLQTNVKRTQSIAVVVMYSDDTIDTAYSGDNNIELVGLLEVLKLN